MVEGAAEVGVVVRVVTTVGGATVMATVWVVVVGVESVVIGLIFEGNDKGPVLEGAVEVVVVSVEVTGVWVVVEVDGVDSCSSMGVGAIEGGKVVTNVLTVSTEVCGIEAKVGLLTCGGDEVEVSIDGIVIGGEGIVGVDTCFDNKMLSPV